MDQYHERGVGGLEQQPEWGDEHGQRELSPEQVESLQRRLREEAMAGTQVGSGRTRAVNSFAKIHEHVLEQLQRESCGAYRVLKRLFSLVYEYIGISTPNHHSQSLGKK